MPKKIYKGTNWEQQPLGLFAEIQTTISDETEVVNVNDIEFENWLLFNFQEIQWTKEENEWRFKQNKKDVVVKILAREEEQNLPSKYISVSFFKNYGDYHGWGCSCDTLAEVRKMINRGLKDLHEL